MNKKLLIITGILSLQIGFLVGWGPMENLDAAEEQKLTLIDSVFDDVMYRGEFQNAFTSKGIDTVEKYFLYKNNCYVNAALAGIKEHFDEKIVQKEKRLAENDIDMEDIRPEQDQICALIFQPKEGEDMHGIAKIIEHYKQLLKDAELDMAENAGVAKPVIDPIQDLRTHLVYEFNGSENAVLQKFQRFLDTARSKAPSEEILGDVQERLVQNLERQKQLEETADSPEKIQEAVLIVLDEFTHTYPQHLQLLYLKKQLLDVQEKFDQFARAIMQLKYKLPNSTFDSDR